MQGTKDQTNSTLFSSCRTEIIPLISDHRQIEVLRNIIDIHILRSQILHTFTFPLLNRPIFRMFRMYKRPKFRMFRQCFLCQHFPVLNVITAVSSCSQIFFWQTVNVICSLFFFHHRFAVSTNKELFRSQLMTYYVQDRKTCTHVQERKSPNNFQNYDTDLFWIFFFASRSRVFICLLSSATILMHWVAGNMPIRPSLLAWQSERQNSPVLLKVSSQPWFPLLRDVHTKQPMPFAEMLQIIKTGI